MSEIKNSSEQNFGEGKGLFPETPDLNTTEGDLSPERFPEPKIEDLESVESASLKEIPVTEPEILEREEKLPALPQVEKDTAETKTQIKEKVIGESSSKSFKGADELRAMEGELGDLFERR